MECAALSSDYDELIDKARNDLEDRYARVSLQSLGSNCQLARVGIGLTAERQSSGEHVIIQVRADSPAKMAGLGSGWIIKAVNFRLVKGLEASQVRDLIMGPHGTKVTLTVQKTYSSRLEHIEIVRDKNYFRQDDLQTRSESGYLKNWLDNIFGFPSLPISSLYRPKDKSEHNHADVGQIPPKHQNNIVDPLPNRSLPDRTQDQSLNFEKLKEAQTPPFNSSLQVDAFVEEFLQRRQNISTAGMFSPSNKQRDIFATRPITNFKTPDDSMWSDAQIKKKKLLSVGNHPLLYRGLDFLDSVEVTPAEIEDLAECRHTLDEKLRLLAEEVRRLESSSE